MFHFEMRPIRKCGYFRANTYHCWQAGSHPLFLLFFWAGVQEHPSRPRSRCDPAGCRFAL